MADTKRKYEKELLDLRNLLEGERETSSQLEIEKNEEQRKLKKFKDDLRDKIECPVCLDTPRLGPVPVCPNGHVVCLNCKAQSCPTCRVEMGEGKSLIAVAIIENIEHECKFVDCSKLFYVDKLNEHMRVCAHRLVVCPQSVCPWKISLSKLLDHLFKSTCSYVAVQSFISHCTVIRTDIGLTPAMRAARSLSWNTHTYSFDGTVFVIYPERHEDVFYFPVVVLDTEDAGSKYRVEIVVHEFGTTVETSEASFK